MNEKAQVSQDEEQTKAGTGRRSGCILLLEDSRSVSGLIESKLREACAPKIVVARSLAEACVVIANHHISFAITGLDLPDASGSEILELLENSDIPAVVYTARHDPVAEVQYAELRLLDYIVKDEAGSVDRLARLSARLLRNADINVLVVDDQRSARLTLVDILSRHNFGVLESRSGAEALAMLKGRTHIDLVITDYHMPDMDGFELVKRIRGEVEVNQPRVIGVTSSSDRRLSSLFLKAGANDFIYRPFLPEEFQCRIDSNVDTLELIARLRRHAERDELTGLPNRRHFFEEAAKRMKSDRAQGVQSAIAILDVDFFKRINDTYGHEAGDDTLRAVAACLHGAVVSTGHLVGRLGGEEFCLYLRDTSGQVAHEICEELIAQIRNLSIVVRSGKNVAVTASAGVTDIQPDESLDNQLHAADQLLYMAKASGRNAVFSEYHILNMHRPADGN